MTLKHAPYLIKLTCIYIGELHDITEKCAKYFVQSTAFINASASWRGYRWSGRKSGFIDQLLIFTSNLCKKEFRFAGLPTMLCTDSLSASLLNARQSADTSKRYQARLQLALHVSRNIFKW